MTYSWFIDQVDSKKLIMSFTIFTGTVYLLVAISGFLNVTDNEAGKYAFSQIAELAKGLAVIS